MDDLIDRKALLAEISKIYNEPRYQHEEEDCLVGLCYIKTVINTTPTIEATPVRHGRWIDKPTGRYGQMQSWCSACGKHSGIGGIKSNRHKPYCPNCGATMEFESNNEQN